MDNIRTFDTLKVMGVIEDWHFKELLDCYLKSDWYDLNSEVQYFNQVCKEIELNGYNRMLSLIVICDLAFKNPIFFKSLWEILKNKRNGYDIFEYSLRNNLRVLFENRDNRRACNAALYNLYNRVYERSISGLKNRELANKAYKYLKYIILDTKETYFVSARLKKIGGDKLAYFEVYEGSTNRKLIKVHKIKLVDKLNDYIASIYFDQSMGSDHDLVKNVECFSCDFSDISKLINIHKENLVMITIGGKFDIRYYGFGR